MATVKNGTEVTTEVVNDETKNLPAVALDFGDEEIGAGLENTSIESFAIPFLQMLQKGTPAVDEDNPNYIQGAKAGNFFNSVTRQIYNGKEGIDIVPVYYERTYIRWGARNTAESGFKGVYNVEDIDKMKHDPSQIKEIEGKFYAPSKDGTVDVKKNDYFADTRSHYVLIIDPETGEFSRAILSLTSSQVKASKTLMTMLANKTVQRADGKKIVPPTYANLVHIVSKSQSDAAGNTWSGVEFSLKRIFSPTDIEIYSAAQQFHKEVKENGVPVDYSKADYNQQGTETEGESHFDRPAESKTF